MTGSGSSCGACKFLRRKCTYDCVFAPYFSYDQSSAHFAAVHKVFGASNVSKLLLHLPVQARSDAAVTISFEALARMRDPVYGCVAHIFALQDQVANLQEEIEILGTQMANLGAVFPDDNNTFDDVGLRFSETNNHNDKSVLFGQDQADHHPLLFQTQSAAASMMMTSADFPGMCAWGQGQDQDQDQDQDHNLSYENDPNLMDQIFEGTEPGTCLPSYPWIMNNVRE